MVNQQLIDYLKERTKDKLLMSPEQLAEEIGIPSKQQSKLRKEGRFPIPFENIGRLVVSHVESYRYDCGLVYRMSFD